MLHPFVPSAFLAPGRASSASLTAQSSFLVLITHAVDFNLDKIKSDDELLTLIHRMMYRTPGKRTVIKKNIREFSGLVYDDEEKDRAKTQDLIGRAFGSTLNAILDIFDLPRGAGPEGVKEAKVGRIVAFLEKPEASAKKNLKVRTNTNGPSGRGVQRFVPGDGPRRASDASRFARGARFL